MKKTTISGIITELQKMKGGGNFFKVYGLTLGINKTTGGWYARLRNRQTNKSTHHNLPDGNDKEVAQSVLALT